MTGYYPIKKAFPMTREELHKLKVGDSIVLADRRQLTVESVGRRWITTSNRHVRIDLYTGLCEPSKTGYRNDHAIFRTLEEVDITIYNNTFIHNVKRRLNEIANTPTWRMSIEDAITLDNVLRGLTGRNK
jgi:hypothetical protein